MTAAATGSQQPEGSAAREAQERATAAKGSQQPEGSAAREAQERAEESSELLLGINVESTAVIVIIDLLALLLIAAVLLTPAGPALTLVGAMVVVFGLAGAALDVREVLHQQREGRQGLVAIVILVALLRLAAASSAAVLAARPRREASQPEGSQLS